MLVVIALGGNALLRRGEPMEAGVQRANAGGTAQAELVRDAAAAELRALELPAGSMRPKVEAICRFVDEGGGGIGGIGSLDAAVDILASRAGTTVRPSRA